MTKLQILWDFFSNGEKHPKHLEAIFLAREKMSSSLAAQLAGIQANNNATILDKSRRKKVHSVSLIYEPKEAATQDFESIYYACIESFRQLEHLDPRFAPFSKTLFSETSIRFDRLVQPAEQAASLNETINRFLMLVANYLNIQPSLGSLEWLVRRFHVHLHNSEQLLLAVLPWYTTEYFVRILDIIPAHEFPPLFKFLSSHKQNLQNLSKSTLVRALYNDQTLYEVVNSYIAQAVDVKLEYNRQLVFWSSINVWVTMAYKDSNKTEILDLLLPHISHLIPLTEQPACQTAGYMALVVLCSQFQLKSEVVSAAITTICSSWSKKSQVHGLAAISQLVRSSGDDVLVPLGKSDWNSIASVPNIAQEILDMAKSHSVEPFVLKWAISLIAHSGDLTQLRAVLEGVELKSAPHIEAVFDALIKLASSGSVTSQTKDQLVGLFEWASAANTQILEKSLAANGIDFNHLELLLESSISRPQSGSQDEPEAEPIRVVESSNENPQILEDSVDIPVSSGGSFLVDNHPDFESRTKLWMRATNAGVAYDQLLSLARINPEAEVSFLAAVSIGPYPQLSRVAATNVLADRLSGSDLDYQGLIPVILVLFHDPARAIRDAASRILEHLASHIPKKSAKVWGAHDLYGASTSKDLVWLSTSDLKSVLKSIVAEVAEIRMDESQIIKVASRAGKAPWMQFLSSHVVATESARIASTLLRVLAGHKGITNEISQFLGSYIENHAVWTERAERSKVSIAVLDTDVVDVVHSSEKNGIKFLETALSTPGDLATMAGHRIALLWNAGNFKAEARNALFGKLVDAATMRDNDLDAMTVLSTLNLDTDVFVHFFKEGHTQRSSIFDQNVNGGPQKRRRRSSSSLQLKDASSEILKLAEGHLQRLTLALELLDQKASTLDSPSELFPQLFQILDELISLGTDSNLPVLYSQELLANCLITLVDSERAKGAIDPKKYSSIRVDVIVSSIRTSDSPQVQNKLLLLVAALATVVPDLVFHSVMPIFTFMGANTVRLDNDFSGYVIQQTISKVIPALVACGDKKEEIEIALRSFVAAFAHIPRHRRNKLYGALVRTLGPTESLYKLLLLLGQKYSDFITKRKLADAKSIMQFTATFVRSFGVYDQLLSLEQYLSYVTSMEVGDSAPDSENAAPLLVASHDQDSLDTIKAGLLNFLATTVGDKTTTSGDQSLQTQISADNVFTPENLALSAKIIDMLLATLDTENESLQDSGLEMLSVTLELLPIDKFANVLSEVLNGTPADGVKQRTLGLIERKFELEMAQDETAGDAAVALAELLTAQLKGDDEDVKPDVIDAIDSLVVKFSGAFAPAAQLAILDTLVGEDGVLNSSVPVVISAINAINSISQNVGVRMISHFGRIMPVLFNKFEQAVASSTSDLESDDEVESEMLQLAVMGLITGLLRRIPSFMASPARRIVELMLISSVDSDSRARVLELVGSKLDNQTVVSAFLASWEFAVRGGTTGVDLLLSALDNVVETSTKKEVAAAASPLFGFVLQAFGVRGLQKFNANDVNQIEARVVKSGVQVVLKLNDQMFRPQFVRMTRWAFQPDSGETPLAMRQLVMFKFIVKLFGRLKSIVTNYYGHILSSAAEILENASDDQSPIALATRKLVYQSLVLSFASDTDDFWQSSARFEQIIQVLLAQLDRKSIEQGPLLVKAVVGLAEATASQEHRKTINDGLSLRLANAQPSSTKIWTIRVLSSLYSRLGEEWVSVLPQLVPLIAELLEDDDEEVEMEVRRKLVPVIEEVLGEPLDKYLS